jgi:hypothetical protein
VSAIEEADLRAYASVTEARASLDRYVADFFNTRCPDSSLGLFTLEEVYVSALPSIQMGASQRQESTWETPHTVQRSRASSISVIG